VILVDTSVFVDYFKATSTPAVEVLKQLVTDDADIGLSPYTYQELLQGARDDLEFARLKRVLITQEFLWLPQTAKTFEKAGRLYFDLRRAGVTVRSTVDVLIALTAMEQKVPLLHSDRDFDHIAAAVENLQIYQV